ncbi:HTH domain-containing protein [Filibacter tadaridae]|uniref:Uncharacterized protein n=1 Tax=Filibacter tadaridae TaxID=2483811 RepID=A0A3P5XKC0_9BACL|nr:HTH domain-containing protein [Filibacter tadaridae]VDC28116.1 hypothetical protein FILTAD_01737 [Filibacter tadaridae]
MKIKIAVIGSNDFCTRIEKLTANRNDVEIIGYRYEEPKDAIDLVRTLTPSDALLFSGLIPYFFAKEAIGNLPIPTVYIEQDEAAIAATLLNLTIHSHLDLNRLSIDVRKRELIEQVLSDANHPTEQPFIHELRDVSTIQEITDYHAQLSLRGQTDIAITSVHSVYEQLKQQQIPVVKIIDTKNTLLQTIERVKQSAFLKKSYSAQTAVGIVSALTTDAILETFVKRLASQLHAHWSIENNVYLLFTTMGNINFSLKNREFLKLFHTKGIDVRLAFGSGESIIDATENAYFALDFIEKTGNHSFYILDSNKKLLGPFPQTDGIIAMKTNEPVLVEMAKKTSLSPANISKLLTFSQSRDSTQFTANDLALHLEVSRRTAERTLKKLLKFSYAKIVGEEMAYRQGRPRALYELNFPTYL